MGTLYLPMLVQVLQEVDTKIRLDCKKLGEMPVKENGEGAGEG